MEHLLDNLDNINTVDKSGMLLTQISMPETYAKALELAKHFLDRDDVVGRLRNQPTCLVVAGMGGSAIGGDILQDWASDSPLIPIYVSRSYFLPAFLDDKSVVFVISYSGDTDETISAFQDAQSRGLKTFSITAGGYLKKLSLHSEVPVLIVPSGFVPRAALPYLFIPLILTYGRLTGRADLDKQIEEMLSVMKKIRLEVSPQVPCRRNPAKQLALNLFRKIPIIYASRRYTGVAFRMKTLFNENSKVPAYSAALPEAFHNEVMSYESSTDLLSSFSALFLRDSSEDPRINAKTDLMKNIIGSKTGTVHEIWAKGTGRLAKILSILYLGDVASTYLAILNGVDPCSTETISKIKTISVPQSQTELDSKVKMR